MSNYETYNELRDALMRVCEDMKEIVGLVGLVWEQEVQSELPTMRKTLTKVEEWIALAEGCMEDEA